MGEYHCFEIEQYGGATVIRLVDPQRMTGLLVGEFQEELQKFVESQAPKRVVIDFGRVAFCSSAVIDALIRAKRRLVSAGGQVRLCDMTPEVREAFGMLNLDGTVFQIVPSVSEAASSFESD
jgi:anti-anti-sigma factor